MKYPVDMDMANFNAFPEQRIKPVRWSTREEYEQIRGSLKEYNMDMKEKTIHYSYNTDGNGKRFMEVREDRGGAFGRQVAGNHYSKLGVQPMEYALKNNLNYAQANAIKYITRYKDKNGVEDLKKAIHCLELLIEHEGDK